MKKIHLSRSHEAFSNIDHLLGNKDNLSKSQKGEEMQAIFSDHSAIKLGINSKSENQDHLNESEIKMKQSKKHWMYGSKRK